MKSLGLALLCALFFIFPVWADEEIHLCYGYGCLVKAMVHYDDAALKAAVTRLKTANDAKAEREELAKIIGDFYAIAGKQTPVYADRGGNFNDPPIGKMDCIDHSTTTTRLLQMLEKEGGLRWHRVIPKPLPRRWAFVFTSHWSAAIREEGSGAVFVVDSWFVDNGEPAVILPLEDWEKGADSNE